MLIVLSASSFETAIESCGFLRFALTLGGSSYSFGIHVSQTPEERDLTSLPDCCSTRMSSGLEARMKTLRSQSLNY